MELVITALASTIFSGFVSKVINDVTDVSNVKNKIINAVKNKTNGYENIESQIYNVIVDVLNKYTNNQYKNNQDKIYAAAEVLFKGFKADEDNKAIKNCLQTLQLGTDKDKCEQFKILLFETLGKNEYNELYHAISLLLLAKKEQLDYIEIEKLNEILQRLDNKDVTDNKEKCFKQIVESRTQEYAKKWNDNMFLNDFSEWDKSSGVNIKLSEVYIEENLPHFLYGNNEELFYNMRNLLSRYIFNNSDENKMLLILGQPGIGKSTLITWIIANFKERIDDMLVYQFASDLKDSWYQNTDISEKLLEMIGLSYNELNGKILILDGFDEIDIKKDKRKYVLDTIYGELIYKKSIKNFTLIITCRENYIHGFEGLKCKYIILQPWNEKQIRSFYNIYCQKNKSKESETVIQNMIKNKDVLGIPLILYMILALDITIEEGSIVDVYDKIFSLDGGIYDRCIDNKIFADKHRIGKIKEQIHQVSREIAFWMFENEPDKAYISQKKYYEICNEIAKENQEENLQQDFVIGNFCKLKHCEGIDSNELYFVHRSIYEYFVVEYIFDSMLNAIMSSKTLESLKSQEEYLAYVFGNFLKKGILSETICEFLKYKIQNGKLSNKFDVILDTFNLMLKNGMTYYTGVCFKNVMNCEMQVFVNMLEIIHLWGDEYIEMNNSLSEYLSYNKYTNLNLRNITIKSTIYSGANSRMNAVCSMPFAGVYLQEAYMAGISLKNVSLVGANFMLADLSGANLEEADLKGTNLSIADLKGANLTKAILEEADLENTDLSNAILKEAMLIRANVTNLNLTGADLTETIFDKNQINYLEKKYDLSKSCVCLETGEIISYEKYIEHVN